MLFQQQLSFDTNCLHAADTCTGSPDLLTPPLPILSWSLFAPALLLRSRGMAAAGVPGKLQKDQEPLLNDLQPFCSDTDFCSSHQVEHCDAFISQVQNRVVPDLCTRQASPCSRPPDLRAQARTRSQKGAISGCRSIIHSTPLIQELFANLLDRVAGDISIQPGTISFSPACRFQRHSLLPPPLLRSESYPQQAIQGENQRTSP